MKVLRWVFTPAGKTTRSGEPPLVLGSADRVVIVVPENLGPRLVRLDPNTGKVLWRGLPLVDVQSTDPESWLVDGNGRHFYHAEGTRLWSWSPDGKLAWQRDLPPSTSWKLAASGETLLAYPARPDSLTFRFRWLAGSVQWRMGPWPDAAGGLSVHCLDARWGELVQRLNVALEHVSLRTGRSSTPRSVVPWAEAGLVPGSVPGLVVSWDRRGLVLGVAGQVRALTME
jgi:hypothetical protein